MHLSVIALSVPAKLASALFSFKNSGPPAEAPVIRLRRGPAHWAVILLLLIAPAAALADGPLVVPGQFSVTPTGAAAYRVPIQVPPGTAGMSPNLSLSYSSQAGNGIVGTGWSLDGLPSIIRCPQTIAQDGSTGTVNFTTGDRFCFHGQRLVAISGAYGADGTEYRTEVDSFSRIVSHGTQGNGPAWFQVWTKSGQIMAFGDTIQLLATGTSTARSWPVDKMSDASGNYMTVNYQQNASAGEVYPIEIDYTFNSAQNLSYYNSVKFSYSARSDIVTQYQVGSSVQTSQLLTNIRTYSGSSLVFDYKLGYQAGGDSARSRLNMLTICQGTDTYCQSNSTQACLGSDGSCIPSTVFTYNDGDAQLTSVGSVSTQAGSLSGYKAYFGDFGGAGRQSVLWDQESGGVSTGNTTIWLSNGGGGFTVAANQPSGLPGYLPFIGDFDGDGKADILWYNPTTYKRVLWLSNGDGSFSVTTNVYGQDGFNYGTPLVADFNGDGLADVLWCVLKDGATIAPKVTEEPGGPDNFIPISYCSAWVNTGTGSFSSAGRFSLSGADWTGDAGYVPLVGNFSGTAKADIFWVPAGGYGNPIIWYAGNGYSNTGTVSSVLWDAVAGMTAVVGNFGSDSNSGILWYAADANGISTSGAGIVWVGQGNGNFTAVNVSVPTGSVPLLGDFDGDGRTDILWDSEIAGGLTTGTRVLWLGNGNGTFHVGSSNPAGENGIMDPSGSTGWHPYVADVIGVGKASVLWDNIDSQQRSVGYRRLWQADSNPPTDSISTIANGVGAQAKVEYSSLANYGSYTKGSSAQYPTLDFTGALWVVSSSGSSNGLGGINTKSYLYNSAQMDLHGRGFLGFGEFQAFDQSSNLIADQRFNQQFPWIGTVQEARSVLYNGTSVSTSLALADQVNSYSNVLLTGPRYAVALQTTSTTRHDLDGTVLPSSVASYTYDFNTSGGTAYGDVLTATSSTSDGFSRTTTNSYGDIVSGTQWLLGRVTQSVVSNTSGGATITRTSTATYNGTTGMPTQTVSEPSTVGTDPIITNFAYDAFGNTLSTSMPALGGPNSPAVAARGSTTAYDAQGRFAISATNALGQTSSVQHDARFGGVTQVTDPNGLSSSSSYDGFGRKTLDIAADGTRASYAYAYLTPSQSYGLSYMVTVTSTAADGATQIGPQKIAYYDILGRALVNDVQGFNGTLSRTQVAYDTFGNVAQQSRPFLTPSGTAQYTVMTYDVLHRLTKSVAPDGTIATHSYSSLMSVDRNADAQTLTTLHNSQGQVVTVTDALGSPTRYGYDPAGDLASVTDVAGNVVSMSYDLRGHLIAKHDPDVGTSSSVYDVLGELRQSTDNKGQVVTATYDLLGRPLSRTEPNLTSSWSYDTAAHGIGKLANAATNQGYALGLTYDALTRPTQSTQTVAGQISSFTVGYDADSRVASIQYPSGFTVAPSYNAYGYGAGTAETDTTQPGPLFTANSMDAEGHLTQSTAGNGIATVRSYNPQNGELQSIAAGPSSGVQSLGYSYDPIGNILVRTDATQGLAESFGYDAINRLTSAALNSNPAVTFGYDAIGNLTTKSDVGSFTYGPSGGAGPHQVQSVDVSSTSPYAAAFAAGTERSYVWTSFNMAASVTYGGKTISFAYDVSHQRITQTAPEGTTAYLRDPITGAMEEKLVSGSTVTARNYFSGGVSIWTQVNGGAVSATIRYIHSDHLGSTAVLTDPTGAVVERDGYDAWGKRRYSNGTTDATGAIASQTDQGYIAQEELPDVSLVHLNARLYDPLIGRFVNADPIGLRGGANVYAYAGNNPIVMSDATGLDPQGSTYDYDGDGADYSSSPYQTPETGSHISGVDTGCDGCSVGGIWTDSSGNRYGLVTIDTATDLGTAGVQVSAQLGQNTETPGMSSEAGTGDGPMLGGSGDGTNAWGSSSTNGALAAAQGASTNNGPGSLNGVDTCGCGVYTPAAGNGQTFTDTQGVGSDGNLLETITVTASKPSPSDVTLLARMIFTEAAGFYDTPNLYNAIGFVAVNRVGAPGYPKTLSGVINQPNQFQGIGGPLFQASANPSSLTGGNGVAFALALSSATNILNGSVPDPTGGAISFYSGPSPGGLSRQINSGQLVVTYSNFPFTFLGNGPR